MAISEKIELLGKGLYTDIPDQLTLTSIPTISELDYVGGEDFDEVMVKSILPVAVKEDINFDNLLEMDYQWILRCLRILNFGPYFTTNSIFCKECGSTSYGEYQVNLNTIECKPLPTGFVNNIKISKDEFIDFNQDITLKLPTVRNILDSYKDKAFQNAKGQLNRELARICYMITSIGTKSNLNPIEIKLIIQDDMSVADYRILKNVVSNVTNYGLRAGGSCQCPKCGDTNALFVAMPDDRFFRPTVGDLRKWKDDRNSRKD